MIKFNLLKSKIDDDFKIISDFVDKYSITDNYYTGWCCTSIDITNVIKLGATGLNSETTKEALKLQIYNEKIYRDFITTHIEKILKEQRFL